MARNLKLLGLAVVAVMALSVMEAQAAFAAPHYFSESSSGNTLLEGSQKTTNEFKAETGITKCTGATFNGTQTSNLVESITIHPTYTGCKLAGIRAEVTTKNATGGYVTTCSRGRAARGRRTTQPKSSARAVSKRSLLRKKGAPSKFRRSRHCTTLKWKTKLKRVRRWCSSPLKSLALNTPKSARPARARAPTNGTYAGTVLMKGFVDETGGTKGAQTGIFVG